MIKRGYSRTINNFPMPYWESTPYKQKNFSKEIMNLVKDTKNKNANCSKAIFIGDVGVGKTTIVNRFCYNQFSDNYKATIGVDFEIENFIVMDHLFNLQIWDTAGQERFKCIAQAYYRNANIIVIVFDMTKLETLYSASSWLNDALNVNSIKPLLFLVGTKCDLLTTENFKNAENKASEIAKQLEAEYWSVSATTGFNILKFFHRMVALSFDDIVLQNFSEIRPSKETNSVLNLNNSSTEINKINRSQNKCNSGCSVF